MVADPQAACYPPAELLTWPTVQICASWEVIGVVARLPVGAAPSPRRGVFQRGSGSCTQAPYARPALVFEHRRPLQRGEGAAPTARIGSG